MSNKMLSLDLSTSCTGYAVWHIPDQFLITYGAISPKVKNPTVKTIPSYTYPKWQALKIKNIVEQILELIELHNPEVLVIEEVVSHKSRLTGKVLDGLHFVLIDRLLNFKGKIYYVDVSGTTGWRPHFKIRLTEDDKLKNKANKKFNKKVKANERLEIVDWKILSARFVNKRYKLNLDPALDTSSGDMADAIAVGACYLDRVKGA